MSNIPQNLKYTKTHEWLKVDGQTGTVGITYHAQHELTDVVYVELPKVGASAKADGAVAVVESVKAASDINAPVSGEITEVNTAVTNDPGLINADPYSKGWLFTIKISSPNEIETLMSAEEYSKFIG
ncbi:MAG: glycine cleavage system protein GcvH [Verrucomicrobiota bacterium]|nr:glycine cleavage system protein GcvH [Verrucomicrobiota bacterium]